MRCSAAMLPNNNVLFRHAGVSKATRPRFFYDEREKNGKVFLSGEVETSRRGQKWPPRLMYWDPEVLKHEAHSEKCFPRSFDLRLSFATHACSGMMYFEAKEAH